MSGFKPTRTSPPSKLTGLAESLFNSTLSTDLSRSTSVSIKELIGLTYEEVELLDAIIARAGASATTFPAVFTAYNAVLKERGLDPSEVVFYGKLLKLGTLKGSNWGEKWQMVKGQQGYGDFPRSSHIPPRALPKPMKNTPTRLTRPDSKISRLTASSTLHSHENESTHLGSDDEDRLSLDVPQYHLLKRPAIMRPASPVHSELTFASDSRKIPLSIHSRPRPPAGGRMWEADASDATEHAGPSSNAPSYRVPVREPAPPRRRIVTPTSPSPTKRPSSSSLATARQLVAQARERKGSVVNEDDAWNKIKILQDEKNADAFRQDWLVEQCWQVWRGYLDWKITTGTQLDQARDILILKQFNDRWRVRVVASKERFHRVSLQENSRHLQTALRIWREKTKEKKLARWRASLRLRMKTVRDKRELKLMKDAMTKWRQAYQTYSADRHYAKSLMLRYYERWRQRLAHTDHLHDVADRLSRVIEGGVLENFWHRWKHASQLQLAYRIVTDSVGLRVKTEVMDVWRRQMRDNHNADAHYDAVLKKRILRSWESARDRIRSMENRAAAHASLQDRRSLRAIYLIMRARYQKRRLEGIEDSGRLKEAWAVWKIQLQRRKKLEDTALAFSLRLKSPLTRIAFEKWRKAYSIHQNLQTVAAFHYSKSLLRRALLEWRVTLRNRHKSMSKARAVDKFLVVRSAWTLLRAKFAERRREYTLQALELRKTRNMFYAWAERAHRRRVQRLAEKQIQERTVKRILTNALARWTNHTIDVKNRELEVTINRDTRLIKSAFKKWKTAQAHHTFVVSLMESYQLVQREDFLKKIFHRWLSTARKTRHRRLTLDRKEAEIKFGNLSVAWDKWKDRFKQQRLQPLEYDVILQSHKNTLAHAFRLWHSKTKSLPAIRFNALRVKRIQARCWNIWREALPRALQAKTAREIEKKAVQSKFFDKWLQAHRTKIALKAVARARYLRLPPAPIRSTARSRPIPAPSPKVSRSIFPRRTVKTEEQTSDGEDELEPRPSWRQKELAGPTSVRSASPPRRSQSRFSMPATRASSPTRSTFGMRLSRESTVFPTRPPSSVTGPEKPSSLLREFRQLQRTKSPSERSRTREPP
ncbi:hypothetical protein K438DRAFT_1806296 [Mycena galopus ATCC 62051]|nr:hypothetical protein K438DRAFT_1806296 [Mycena galopus ATCC 62051]